jgi:hypothetical protein
MYRLRWMEKRYLKRRLFLPVNHFGGILNISVIVMDAGDPLANLSSCGTAKFNIVLIFCFNREKPSSSQQSSSISVSSSSLSL